jgi:hypothetical protein
VQRAKIILLIAIWLKRFMEERLAGLFSRQSQLPDPFYADLFFHGLTKSRSDFPRSNAMSSLARFSIRSKIWQKKLMTYIRRYNPKDKPL